MNTTASTGGGWLYLLQPGSRVTRMLGGVGGIAMEMEVTGISNDLITCAAVRHTKDGTPYLVHGNWTFSIVTGAEVDDSLGWSAFGPTGSFLMRKV